MEGLSRTKRMFILLVLMCIVLSYFIYDSRWRSENLVRSQTHRSRFPVRKPDLWSTTTIPSLTRHIISTSSSIIASEDTQVLRRVQGNGNDNTGSFVRKDKELLENSTHTLRVDSTDKIGSIEFNAKSRKAANSNENKIAKNSVGDPTSSEKSRKRRLPNAIIIGVKKGGTRALLEILKIHPDVRACNTEVHFFDREQNYKRGLEWYRSQMPLSFSHQITLEKSPAYFVTNAVPGRVKKMSKSVKLIVVVRDPTRRAISDYTQSMVKKPFIQSFQSFAIKDLKAGVVKENWRKLQIGLYDVHLEKWLEHFPLEQFHFVSGEELIKNPASEIEQLEKFLNLRPYINEDNFVFNETKGFYCLLGKKSDHGRKDKPNCMGKTKGRTHPSIPGDVLHILHDYYRPHNLKFYKMVNRDFEWP